MMKYVIIGASAAGISAAETLRELDEHCEIIVISDDAKVYSRCMLHHLVGGHKNTEALSFIENDFFVRNSIQWLKGQKVISVQPAQKEVLLNDGKTIFYDKLLIATGAASTIPPIQGLREAKGIFKFRDLADAEAILEACKTAKSAVVIGGGLVGADAAVGLLEQGLKVTIVDVAARLLALQLDARSSDCYKQLFENAGASVITGTAINEAKMHENGQIKSVVICDGTEINCDLVVVAAGVKPNTGFLSGSNIKIDRGIVIDDQMQTSVQDIYAAGDVTGISAIWPSAVKQGRTAACNMSGQEMHYSDLFTAKNSMNLLGTGSVSLGMIDPPDETYTVSILDNGSIYKKIIHKDGIIYGAILQNDISRCGLLTSLIKDKLSIRNLQKSVFDLSYADFFDIDQEGNYHLTQH